MGSRTVAFWTFAAFAVALAACSARTAGVPGAANPAKARANVTLRVHVWPKGPVRTPAQRHQRFIAASTLAIVVDAYQPNSVHGAATLLASATLDLSPGSSSCDGSGDARVCSITLRLPPPGVDLVLTSWDEAPAASGGVPSTAKQLAAGSFTDLSINAGQNNTPSVTLGGIPASLALALPSPTPVAGITTSYIHGVASSENVVGVTAYDADGNAILADGFVDAGGSAKSVSLQVGASSSACGSATLLGGNAASGSKIAIPSPPANGVTFEYGATAIASPFPTASPCTFTLSASFPGATGATGAFTLLGPTIATVSAGSGSMPVGITSVSNANLWFADCADDQIDTVSVSSPYTITKYSVGATSPRGIVIGPDQKVWFTAKGAVGSITTDGATVKLYTPAPIASDQLSSQMSVGPYDVLIWFTDPTAGDVDRISTDGVMEEYPASPAPSGTAIPVVTGITENTTATSGQYGDLYFTETTPSAYGSIDPSGGSEQVTALSVNGTDPSYILYDPSAGTLWYTSSSQGTITELTEAGGRLSFAVPGAASEPVGLTIGPDGAVWFADADGYLDRIPTDATSPSQITRISTGAGSSPQWLVTGSDGAIWYTDLNDGSGNDGTGGKIGRLTY